MNTLEKRLIALQQQLDMLNVEVANLVALTSTHTAANTIGSTIKPLVKRPLTNTPASIKGLNRFRQLANEQA